MKYTQQQYEASAKKHGIPCGPYERKTDSMYHVRIFNSPNGSELATVHYRGDHVEREQDRLGFVVKDVPDLLIALDEKDAEIERLRKAIECLHDLADSEYWPDLKGETSRRFSEVFKLTIAALQGGGA
jgi:hypothetical protein